MTRQRLPSRLPSPSSDAGGVQSGIPLKLPESTGSGTGMMSIDGVSHDGGCSGNSTSSINSELRSRVSLFLCKPQKEGEANDSPASDGVISRQISFTTKRKQRRLELYRTLSDNSFTLPGSFDETTAHIIPQRLPKSPTSSHQERPVIMPAKPVPRVRTSSFDVSVRSVREGGLPPELHLTLPTTAREVSPIARSPLSPTRPVTPAHSDDKFFNVEKAFVESNRAVSSQDKSPSSSPSVPSGPRQVPLSPANSKQSRSTSNEALPPRGGKDDRSRGSKKSKRSTGSNRSKDSRSSRKSTAQKEAEKEIRDSVKALSKQLKKQREGAPSGREQKRKSKAGINPPTDIIIDRNKAVLDDRGILIDKEMPKLSIRKAPVRYAESAGCKAQMCAALRPPGVSCDFSTEGLQCNPFGALYPDMRFSTPPRRGEDASHFDIKSIAEMSKREVRVPPPGDLSNHKSKASCSPTSIIRVPSEDTDCIEAYELQKEIRALKRYTDRRKEPRESRKVVRFARPIVTSIKHRPFTSREDAEKLFFAEEELDQLEQDRAQRVFGEQVECIASDNHDTIAVSFPTRIRRRIKPISAA